MSVGVMSGEFDRGGVCPGGKAPRPIVLLLKSSPSFAPRTQALLKRGNKMVFDFGSRSIANIVPLSSSTATYKEKTNGIIQLPCKVNREKLKAS